MYRQSEKNLLNSNISPTCPHNMVNFGPLAAEIVSLVWGTPGNFNGFRVLAALMHDTLVVGVSQTAALNRGRHLYSTGRPSRWALAHISSWFYLAINKTAKNFRNSRFLFYCICASNGQIIVERYDGCECIEVGVVAVVLPSLSYLILHVS